jgi:hypothetical protein
MLKTGIPNMFHEEVGLGLPLCFYVIFIDLVGFSGQVLIEDPWGQKFGTVY